MQLKNKAKRQINRQNKLKELLLGIYLLFSVGIWTMDHGDLTISSLVVLLMYHKLLPQKQDNKTTLMKF